MLELDNVAKHYPVREGVLGLSRSLVRAVDGVSLTLAAGESLGLVGESGCGKSTLGRLALALEQPTSGEVRFAGQPLFPHPPEDFRRRAQMIFQDPYSSLNPRQKVGSIIAEPLAIHHQGDRAARSERVRELLELVGLRPEHAARYPHEFSGGQRQRIAIARSLALNPDLVVCDEPVSALDVSIQAQVLNLLEDLQERLGLAYLFISHDLAVVYTLCERVAVMYMGQLMELADREALYARPVHPYTQTLLAAVPVPDPASTRSALPESARQAGDELARRLDRVAEGCTFAPRCAQAGPECPRQRPAWHEVEPGHWVACYAASTAAAPWAPKSPAA